MGENDKTKSLFYSHLGFWDTSETVHREKDMGNFARMKLNVLLLSKQVSPGKQTRF